MEVMEHVCLMASSPQANQVDYRGGDGLKALVDTACPHTVAGKEFCILLAFLLLLDVVMCKTGNVGLVNYCDL